jgi:hypothetical protein
MRTSVVVGFEVSDKLTARGILFWIRMEFEVAQLELSVPSNARNLQCQV